MNYDSFLEIGSQHKVCEDFIASGVNPCPHVILSDGCSASENTNYGAMILVQLAKRYLYFRGQELDGINYDDMGNWIIHSARAIIESMGLNPACLDATLIVSYSWKGFVYVYVYGDGFIITKSPTGLLCSEIFFSSDSPYYLSYRTDYFRRKAYENSGYFKMVKSGFLDGDSGGFRKEDRKHDFSLCHKYGFADFKEVYIASDGINSFVRNGEKLSTRNAIKGFLDMERENRDRNTRGVFVQRRCRKAIKVFRKDGWDHYDDISFGGFLCDTM